MRRPLPPLSEISRLLIVKTSSIGDVVHALPVVQAIKEAAPHLSLGWVVRRRCAEVLRGSPFIDTLYVQPDRPTLPELWSLSQKLQEGRYELALDMQGLALSGLVTQLSGAPLRLGWDRNRELNALFLTHPIVSGRGRQNHEVDLLYGFAEALGIQAPHPNFTPQPYLASRSLPLANQWLAELPRPRVALNVGASRAYKRWPTDRWREVALALAAAGRSLVFVGDKTDAGIVAQIAPSLRGNFADLSGRTSLPELASVLASCDLLVTGDTGPMHIAVAVGTPVLALFGGTDPVRHGPYGARNIVLYKPVPGLIPPGKRPTDAQGAACMAQITASDVLDVVQSVEFRR
jgi:heptosyltransferase-1